MLKRTIETNRKAMKQKAERCKRMQDSVEVGGGLVLEKVSCYRWNTACCILEPRVPSIWYAK